MGPPIDAPRVETLSALHAGRSIHSCGANLRHHHRWGCDAMLPLDERFGLKWLLHCVRLKHYLLDTLPLEECLLCALSICISMTQVRHSQQMGPFLVYLSLCCAEFNPCIINWRGLHAS